MNSLSTEQLSAADIRAMVGGEDRLDSRTTPKGHWQATDGRPSSLLRPARNKRFASSFVHLVGVTIASLAAVYLLLRCFEHTVLSHGQGAAARLLATGRNNPEDECTRSEKEQDSGKEPEDNEHRTLSTGLEGIPDEPGTSTALTPPAPDYAGAPWGESGAAIEGGEEAVYDEPVRELTEEQERWAQAAEWYPKGMKGAAEPKTWTGEGGRHPDAVAMGEAQGKEGVWTGEEGRYPDGVEGARGQEASLMQWQWERPKERRECGLEKREGILTEWRELEDRRQCGWGKMGRILQQWEALQKQRQVGWEKRDGILVQRAGLQEQRQCACKERERMVEQ
ncbi:hypothetical protein EPH_0033780 [Eimeria praecox]|uniref:Transmembrane protein n=1 Tax=Eimeria praecox TaxID=51316 RepID=U6G2R8_9EIME|nr:hypothetical protein EPH_0033780 [Eimeria praecox]